MAEAEMDPALRERIQGIVDAHPVVLFMKGSRLFPRCGFSATVVEVLKRSGVTAFHDVDVLKDPAIRQGIKEFTSWPTIPQVFIDGEFVGGCDIMINMHEEGELAKALGVDGEGK